MKKILLLLIVIMSSVMICACSSSASATSVSENESEAQESLPEIAKEENAITAENTEIVEDEADEEPKPHYARDIVFTALPENMKISNTFADNLGDSLIIPVKDINTEKYGFINGNCEIVVPLEYDNLAGMGDQLFHEEKTLVGTDGVWTVVNSDGTIGKEINVGEDYYVRGLTDGMLLIENTHANPVLYGYADEAGNIVIPTDFNNNRIDYGAYFRNGRAIVDVGDSKSLIDKDGRGLLDFWPSISFLTDDLFCIEGYGKYGVADHDGNIIVPVEYDKIYQSVDEGMIQVTLNDKVGYFDQNGAEIVPAIYDSLTIPDDGMFVAKQGDKYSIVNTSGDVIIPEGKYGELLRYDSFNGLITAEKDGKYGIINEKEDIIVPFEYDDLGMLKNNGDTGVAYACKDGKYGYVDVNGNVVIPFEYDDATSFQKTGYAVVTINGANGIVDKNNNLVVPCEYEKFSVISDAPYITLEKESGKWVFSTETGTLINPEYTYDSVRSIGDGFIVVGKDNKYGIVNMYGEEIAPMDYINIISIGKYITGNRGEQWDIGVQVFEE